MRLDTDLIDTYHADFTVGISWSCLFNHKQSMCFINPYFRLKLKKKKKKCVLNHSLQLILEVLLKVIQFEISLCGKWLWSWFNKSSLTGDVIPPCLYKCPICLVSLSLSPLFHVISLTVITPVFINWMILINVPLPHSHSLLTDYSESQCRTCSDKNVIFTYT